MSNPYFNNGYNDWGKRTEQSNASYDANMNSWYNMAFDVERNGLFTKWFSPGEVQDKEFAQQMVAMDYQNWYNDPVRDMERKKNAGINLNLAAAGIADQPNTSASPASVPSNDGGTLGDAAATVASVAGAVTGIGKLGAEVANLEAGTAKTIAETAEVAPNAWQQRYLQGAQAKAFLAKAGFDEAATTGLMIENQYKGQQMVLDISTKIQNLKNMDAEYWNAKRKFELMQSEIDRNRQEIRESESRVGLNNASKGLIQLQQQEQQLRNQELTFDKEFRDKWNFKYGSAADNCLFGVLSDGRLSFDERVGRSSMLLKAFSFEPSIDADYQIKVNDSLEETKTSESWKRPILGTKSVSSQAGPFGSSKSDTFIFQPSNP